ncbi:homoserine dehydrogenase [Meiothermus rufus]|uniref:homoserine dehydrogenase n=1 Tax=Meiothermus rufus TaxID=604332 RepID=UPI00040D80F2|nr:homoserine dehydrogenase [Meiothermus rufus]
MKTIHLALMGAGTVGQALLELLPTHQARFQALGLELKLARILVRDRSKPRPGVPAHLLTDEPKGFLEGADLLVEVAGGTAQAGEVVLEALARGLPVVTANKALLAERWDALREHAEAGRLHYEASVMAGTPVLGALQSLWGNQTLALHGIVNGTCSYIIQRLEEGATYAEAFAEAGALGYLEADPTLDVGGIDAAHKICVLGRLTVDPGLAWAEVQRRTRGIAHLTPQMLRQARAEGYAIRLVASLYPSPEGWVGAVRPVRLPQEHPLVQLGSGRNALVYQGHPVGSLVFAGPGAGGGVTASAVLGDIYRALSGQPGHRPLPAPAPLPAQPAPAFEEV